jgi:hypothetical protein
MPGCDAIEPLAPDACRDDHSAPCYCLHLKNRALNGERQKLSAEELEFVGVGNREHAHGSDGWHSITGLLWMTSADANDVEGDKIDAAIVKAYRFLGMVPPQDRLGFLGG